MADRDPAFLWETEALRTSPSTGPGTGGGSVDLRRAHELTGIPVSTLRKWARKGKVPSTLEETDSGLRRMVDLDAVRERARRLAEPTPGGSVAKPEPARRGKHLPASQSTPTEEPVTPPGTMLVPIDAWEKMLIQLGNLHEAGQQLAEARERAARAETEAAFLRERLAELRAARDSQQTSRTEPPAEDETPAAEPAPAIPSFTAYLWRLAASGGRRRKR